MQAYHGVRFVSKNSRITYLEGIIVDFAGASFVEIFGQTAPAK